MKPTITLVVALILLTSAGMAMAVDVRDQLLAQLRRMGYTEFTVSTTLLGRLQVVASDGVSQREIVVNPRTREVLRDYSSSILQTAPEAMQPLPAPNLVVPLVLDLPAPEPQPAASPDSGRRTDGPLLLDLVLGTSKPEPEPDPADENRTALTDSAVEAADQPDAEASGDSSAAGQTDVPSGDGFDQQQDPSPPEGDPADLDANDPVADPGANTNGASSPTQGRSESDAFAGKQPPEPEAEPPAAAPDHEPVATVDPSTQVGPDQ